MAKAGLTIAISGTYNGRALERARQDLEKMRITATSELGGAGSTLINFGSAAAEVGGEIHNLGYKMERVGTAATRNITVPIAAAATACGMAAVDIDTALTGVRKTVDATEAEYQALKEAAIEYSKTNAISATDILNAEELAGQLGVSKDNLFEFAKVATGLDLSTNMNVEQASTNLARFANVTNMSRLEGEEAAEAYRAYGNTIVGLGNNTATTESEISDFSLRIASAGTQAGMSEADILGVSAAMSSLGLEAAAGGSAFSKTISEISIAVATGSEDLEKYAALAGMSAEEFAEYWKRDATNAFIDFVGGVSESSEDMNVILEDLGISELRQSDALRRMAGNTDLVRDAVRLANQEWQNGSALATEVANKNDSMAAKFQILQNKAIAVAESVGTPLVNALIDVIDAAEPLIQHVSDIAQGFADMDKEDQQMILGLVGAAAAFGPVMTGAGKLTQGIGDLVVGVGKGAQHFGLLKGEISNIISTMKGAGGQTVALGEVITGLGSSQLPLVTGALGAVKVALLGLGIGAAVIAIGAIISAIADWIHHTELVEKATTGLEDAMDSAEDAYNRYAGGASNAAKSLGEVKASADECLDAQAKLADSMSETWAEYGANAAVVDAYAQEIEHLTQKYDEQDRKMKLTEEEQTRLRLAVDGYNEATGASIEVIDAQNGILSQSTETVLANAEAFKERARAEAAMEMYKDLYKQQLQDEMALQDATEALARAKEKEAGAWANVGYNGVNPYTGEVIAAQRTVAELTDAMESNQRTQDRLIGVVMETSRTFDSFDQALQQSGVSVEDFGNLSEAELEELRSNFDGTLASIVTMCAERGYEVPTALADAMRSKEDYVYEAGTGLGESTDAGYAAGISGNSDKPASAADNMVGTVIDAIKSKLDSHSPSRVMEAIGRDADLGLEQGISGNKSLVSTVAGEVADAVREKVKGLPEYNRGVGDSAGRAIAVALGAHSGDSASAASLLESSARSPLMGLPSMMGAVGSSAGWGFASSLSANSGSSGTAGSNLGSAALSGARVGTVGMGVAGAIAALSFAQGMGSYDTSWGGMNAAHTARSGMASVSAHNTGYNFSAGFANGMYGVDLWSRAYNIGISALSGIKAALGVRSPSREAYKVGEFFGEGAVLGMRSTEGDIAEESRRMAEAMDLSPSLGSYATDGYVSGYQQGSSQGRIINFNVTVNVQASDAAQAVGIGRSIGEEMYLEFARRERVA